MELRLREIGAGVAGKVCTAYLSCSETTTVLFQCVRQGDSRSWAMSISGGLVMATSVRGQSHWWEALLSSLQDSLQLHLQSSCPESWPAVIQAQQVFLWLSDWAEQPWNSAMNEKMVYWGFVTVLSYRFGEKPDFWNGFQLGPFQPQSITFNYLPGAQGIRQTLINSMNMQIVSSFVISTVCSWHSCYGARL